MKGVVPVFAAVLMMLATITDVSAQDLSGIWRGNFGSGQDRMTMVPGLTDRYKFEVQLDQTLKKFSGVTYSYKTTVFYGKASCSGTINPQTKKVLLEELKILEVRMSMATDACVMTCFLTYSKVNDEEFLQGTFYSTSIRDSSNCGKGWVVLRKVPTSDFYKEPFILKQEELALKKSKRAPAIPEKPKPAIAKKAPLEPDKKPAIVKAKPPVTKEAEKPVAEPQKPPRTATVDTPVVKEKVKPPKVLIPKVLASRTNELVKVISTSSKRVTINIYDNGAIDNDTISVYLNNRLVIDKQRLTERAITVTIELDEENNEHEIVMVAENLGEIPPNTSLMVVKAGDKQYEVRITSNEQKNAVVKFRYEAKE